MLNLNYYITTHNQSNWTVLVLFTGWDVIIFSCEDRRIKMEAGGGWTQDRMFWMDSNLGQLGHKQLQRRVPKSLYGHWEDCECMHTLISQIKKESCLCTCYIPFYFISESIFIYSLLSTGWMKDVLRWFHNFTQLFKCRHYLLRLMQLKS